MKEFKLKKNSWHFKLATFGGIDEYDEETNICRYFWKGIVPGSAVIALLVALAGAVVFIVGASLYHWYLLFTTGVVKFGVILTLVGFTTSGVIYLLDKFLTHHREEKREFEMAKRKAVEEGTYKEPEPGFFKQVYNSFKNKTCHKIVFEDGEDKSQWDGS